MVLMAFITPLLGNIAALPVMASTPVLDPEKTVPQDDGNMYGRPTDCPPDYVGQKKCFIVHNPMMKQAPKELEVNTIDIPERTSNRFAVPGMYGLILGSGFSLFLSSSPKAQDYHDKAWDEINKIDLAFGQYLDEKVEPSVMYAFNEAVALGHDVSAYMDGLMNDLSMFWFQHYIAQQMPYYTNVQYTDDMSSVNFGGNNDWLMITPDSTVHTFARSSHYLVFQGIQDSSRPHENYVPYKLYHIDYNGSAMQDTVYLITKLGSSFVPVVVTFNPDSSMTQQTWKNIDGSGSYFPVFPFAENIGHGVTFMSSVATEELAAWKLARHMASQASPGSSSYQFPTFGDTSAITQGGYSLPYEVNPQAQNLDVPAIVSMEGKHFWARPFKDKDGTINYDYVPVDSQPMMPPGLTTEKVIITEDGQEVLTPEGQPVQMPPMFPPVTPAPPTAPLYPGEDDGVLPGVPGHVPGTPIPLPGQPDPEPGDPGTDPGGDPGTDPGTDPTNPPTDGNLLDWLKALIETIITLLQNIWNWAQSLTFVVWFTSIIGYLGDLIGLIQGLFSELFSLLGGMLEPVLTVLSTMLDPVLNAFDTLWSRLTIIADAIGNIASPILTSLTSLFEMLWTNLTSIVSALATLAEPIVTTITTALGTVTGWLSDIVVAIGEIIKPIVNPIGSILTTVVNIPNLIIQGIESLFSTLFVPTVSVQEQFSPLKEQAEKKFFPADTFKYLAAPFKGASCDAPRDMYANLFGMEMKVFDSSFIEATSQWWKPIISGFLWFMFGFWLFRRMNMMASKNGGASW